jgi:Domain of unknown function (DUF4191)
MPSLPSIRLPGRKSAGRPGAAPAGKSKGKPKAPPKAKPPKAKRSRADRRAGRRARLTQLRQAFTLTRQRDPKMLPIVIAVFFAVLLLFVLLGILIGHPVFFTIFGVLFGLLAGVSIFGRRAQRAAFSQVEGQPGAAVAVVQSMRGQWEVTPVVAATRNQDVIHRVLGRPGIVLIGEGSPARVTSLLAQERRRISRVASETPVYDLVIGDEDGQVPLRKLQSHMMKLPHNLRQPQVRLLEDRLRALGTAQPPVPKGPMPRNARMPRGRPR